MRVHLSALLLGAVLLAVPNTLRAQRDSANVPVAPLASAPSSTWGGTVWVIDSAEIAKSTAQTFSELLQARRPGVRVLRSGGLASDGAMVMLRGPRSMIGGNEPLLIVDGIRVDSRQYDLAQLAANSGAPSRLDDLFPEDIERIEVLSGPAAALYGDGAANGVIVVTTKSGGGSPLRLSGRAAWDANKAPDVFPANYQRLGVDPSTGQPVSYCALVVVAVGQCKPTGLDVWNPLEQASPFRIGNSARGHLELGGTTLGAALFAAVTGDQRQGTLPHDESARLGFRGKIDRALPAHLDLQASGGWLRDNARLGVDGNTTVNSNVLANGLLGTAQNDTNHGYRTGFGAPGDSIYPDDLLRHFTGSLVLRWRPLAWLNAAATTGRDRVSEHWRYDQLGFARSSLFPVSRTIAHHDQFTSGGRVGASYHFGSLVAASTDINYERDVLQTSSFDTVLAPGYGAFDGSRFQNRSTSLSIEERAVLGDRIALSAAMQRVTSSIFGSGGGKEWFPSANASWSTRLRAHGVSDLRLRAAYAESPGPSGSLFLLDGVVVPTAPTGQLKMERTRDIEVGADATLGAAAHVSVTAYTSRSSHLWVPATVAQPPAVGFFTNGPDADMSNIGLEALVDALILQGHDVRWTGSLSLALQRNRVTQLNGVPQMVGNDPMVQGYAFGGVWARPYTYSDANGDGILSGTELGYLPLTYIGPPLPTLESALSTDLALGPSIVVSGTFDYRRGNRVVDHTGELRCNFAICRGTEDPSSSLAEQAAGLGGSGTAGFAEDGAFMRVREIAVHWTLPASWSGPGGTRAQLTVAARNLVTWTHYRGLDPEVSYQDPAILPRQDFMTMPLPRELVVRLDFGQR